MKKRQCRKCLQTKPQTEFYKHPFTTDKLSKICKLCQREYSLKWKRLNPDKVAAQPSRVYVRRNTRKRVENVKLMRA